MHKRLSSAFALSLGAAVAVWLANPVLAQAPAAATTKKPKPISRTADGKPDL